MGYYATISFEMHKNVYCHQAASDYGTAKSAVTRNNVANNIVNGLECHCVDYTSFDVQTIQKYIYWISNYSDIPSDRLPFFGHCITHTPVI